MCTSPDLQFQVPSANITLSRDVSYTSITFDSALLASIQHCSLAYSDISSEANEPQPPLLSIYLNGGPSRDS